MVNILTNTCVAYYLLLAAAVLMLTLTGTVFPTGLLTVPIPFFQPSFLAPLADNVCHPLKKPWKPKLYAIRTFMLKDINERKAFIELGGKSPNERGKPSCPHLSDLSVTNNDLPRTSCTFKFIIAP